MATLKPKGNMFYTLREMKLSFRQEYVFHPTRQWRFDFAIVDQKVAIEYEGIFSESKSDGLEDFVPADMKKFIKKGKSRHTTLKGYTGDVEKYNEGVKLGWRILRYTTKNYKNLRNDLTQLLCLPKTS